MSESGQHRSILIVDDEPTLRMAFSLALADEHTRVEEAVDGAQALLKLSERAFDLVLMDLRMPLLSGLEAVARLRARGNHCPVILCSAYLTVDDALLALRYGVVDFLAKPVELTRLREVVNGVLLPGSGPMWNALDRARRMEFHEALATLLPVVAEDEEIRIWLETFRWLASPDQQQPGGFFDASVGRARVERLVLAS
ncbi:response regulator [Luteolibacter ambystomatis]|uniref:Response regulator n=1 Tax=Luteolibacter ambystomatis TaxID=2824561 RepID=A0A975G7Q0_9BACT|nr:response regulator [Luteolibacter ambystomatis]QUE50301.1 response regulator [Luteolibacter ambystomatis]